MLSDLQFCYFLLKMEYEVLRLENLHHGRINHWLHAYNYLGIFVKL
jgi:hypothetical protein